MDHSITGIPPTTPAGTAANPAKPIRLPLTVMEAIALIECVRTADRHTVRSGGELMRLENLIQAEIDRVPM